MTSVLNQGNTTLKSQFILHGLTQLNFSMGRWVKCELLLYCGLPLLRRDRRRSGRGYMCRVRLPKFMYIREGEVLHHYWYKELIEVVGSKAWCCPNFLLGCATAFLRQLVTYNLLRTPWVENFQSWKLYQNAVLAASQSVRATRVSRPNFGVSGSYLVSPSSLQWRNQ